MDIIITTKKILQIQQDNTIFWHSAKCAITSSEFYALVENNHQYNFQLWHEEDKARRDDCGFEYVYRAKRNIDQLNQQRNNYMEAMDEWIFHHYQPRQNNCVFHSETPGMMIDRLSILALKEYHMREQTLRNDVTSAQLTISKKKLKIIIRQLQHLADCLDFFLKDIVDGRRSFRLYHQFKMYNDPTLNPQLYKRKDYADT